MPDHTNTPLLGKKPPVSRPKYQRRRSSFEASAYNSAGRSLSFSKKHLLEEDANLPGLNILQMLCLTVCMAGVQFTCKLYLYLCSLSLKQTLTPDIMIASLYNRDCGIIVSKMSIQDP